MPKIPRYQLIDESFFESRDLQETEIDSSLLLLKTLPLYPDMRLNKRLSASFVTFDWCFIFNSVAINLIYIHLSLGLSIIFLHGDCRS